ncbi:hypothetical protein [Rhodanobacter sp. FW106-PBR-R2A-1-13]|uniref:hypothetical protein n=1 Tax=Rhodanobacter sp. FW106-PBR-R2A-1-13 TaxID=3454845 RepID=UPI0034E482ED
MTARKPSPLPPPWTAAELRVLAGAYRDGGWRGASEALGGTRTKRAIQIQAIALGLKSKQGWTTRDIRTLSRMARESADHRVIAKVLGRTEKAVELQLRRLGIAHKQGRRASRPITRSDVTVLRQAARTRQISEAATELGIGYAVAVVRLAKDRRRKRRKTTPWTDTERLFLLKHYATRPIEWMRENLPTQGTVRTASAIRIMASTIGLTAGRRAAATRGVIEKRARATVAGQAHERQGPKSDRVPGVGRARRPQAAIDLSVPRATGEDVAP